MEKLGNWADEPCYYVSIVDAGRYAQVAGPFRTHEAALAAVDTARRIGAEVDPWSHFYGWGTCKVETGHREGRLNAKLAAINPSINRGEWN